MGRRLVSPRIFRRRHAAGFGAERRVPDRLAHAVVGRAVAAGRPAAGRARDGSRARPPGAPRRAGRAAADAAFDRMAHDPGYIKGYLPGVRENGGQYTHAALWTVIALAQLGLGDEAMELFHMINPINHMRTPADSSSTARSRTSSPPTSMRTRCTSAAAAGRGTPDRRVDVPRRHRGAARTAPPGLDVHADAEHSGDVAVILNRLARRREDAIPHHGRQSRPPVARHSGSGAGRRRRGSRMRFPWWTMAACMKC